MAQDPEQPSPYQILLTPAAQRDLKNLPRSVLQRVDRKLLSLGNDPRQHGAKKLAGRENRYRVRVGDYRIIYEIDDQKRVVVVARIRHRREVYE